jgi:hypothetical protein
VRSGWDKTVFAPESLAVKRIDELIELNDGVTKFTTFETSIEVVIANARRIIDLSGSFGGTSGSHESDCTDRFCLKKPQLMDHVGKFILSIIMVFGLSSDLCHVFRSNIKDNIGGDFGITESRRFSGKLSLCPVEHLFRDVTGYGIVNGNRYKLELSSTCWMGSIWMGMMKVFNGILGGGNVQYRFPSFFFSRITLPDNPSNGQGIVPFPFKVMSLK